jgi:hypothetical protein
MAFSLRQLQFFVAAAEAGSVSGAARALSISQSSVTEAPMSRRRALPSARRAPRPGGGCRWG